MIAPAAAMLPDRRRLHLQHGPIDLIVEAFGAATEIEAAYRQAEARFQTVLTELVAELPRLRRPLDPADGPFRSPTARRMAEAVARHAGVFITPMAAVAGAVADEVLAALTAGRRLDRAYVNNGGDIALHIAPGQRFDIGLMDRAETPQPLGKAIVRGEDPVRGVATSGCGGRSFSLGIADAVTVLAENAADADAAATLIANAVDPGPHPAIQRRPAEALDPDSDLGPRPVTVAVGPLDEVTVARAMQAGVAAAEAMLDCRAIRAAALSLQGRVRLVGSCAEAITETLEERRRHARR